jgi:hypothetical protein
MRQSSAVLLNTGLLRFARNDDEGEGFDEVGDGGHFFFASNLSQSASKRALFSK